jgi:ribosomal protein S18 acetylase RimI-like enzyme
VTRETAIGTFAVRRAGPADADALARLGRETFAETFAADNTPEDLEAFLAETYGTPQQARELADPDGACFLAESAGEAVGYVQLRAKTPPTSVPERPALEIARLYVRAAWQGRGPGGALMRAALDEAARRGARAAWLGVWERNAKAIAFYRKWGFEPAGTQVFRVGCDPQTDHVMARRLGVEGAA